MSAGAFRPGRSENPDEADERAAGVARRATMSCVCEALPVSGGKALGGTGPGTVTMATSIGGDSDGRGVVGKAISAMALGTEAVSGVTGATGAVSEALPGADTLVSGAEGRRCGAVSS